MNTSTRLVDALFLVPVIVRAVTQTRYIVIQEGYATNKNAGHQRNANNNLFSSK